MLEDIRRDQLVDRAALNLRLFEQQVRIGVVAPITASIVQEYMTPQIGGLAIQDLVTSSTISSQSLTPIMRTNQKSGAKRTSENIRAGMQSESQDSKDEDTCFSALVNDDGKTSHMPKNGA